MIVDFWPRWFHGFYDIFRWSRFRYSAFWVVVLVFLTRVQPLQTSCLGDGMAYTFKWSWFRYLALVRGWWWRVSQKDSTLQLHRGNRNHPSLSVFPRHVSHTSYFFWFDIHDIRLILMNVWPKKSQLIVAVSDVTAIKSICTSPWTSCCGAWATYTGERCSRPEPFSFGYHDACGRQAVFGVSRILSVSHSFCFWFFLLCLWSYACSSQYIAHCSVLITYTSTYFASVAGSTTSITNVQRIPHEVFRSTQPTWSRNWFEIYCILIFWILKFFWCVGFT